MSRTRPLPDADPAALRREIERLEAELALARARAASLEALAHEDALTGVANRRGFLRDLERALAYRARHATPIALILLDLDRFKAVNDTHGHAVGDRALAHLAATLRAHVRASDSLGRLGGDEFALLAWQIEPAAAEAKARALEAIVAGAPLDALPLSISAGATMLADGDSPETALARADAAMYACKRGRDALPSPGGERGRG
jgi:diguanylate cyclase (GGDEF)-like protein